MECRRGLVMRILSVCQTRELWLTEQKSVQIFIPYKRPFNLVCLQIHVPLGLCVEQLVFHYLTQNDVCPCKNRLTVVTEVMGLLLSLRQHGSNPTPAQSVWQSEHCYNAIWTVCRWLSTTSISLCIGRVLQTCKPFSGLKWEKTSPFQAFSCTRQLSREWQKCPAEYLLLKTDSSAEVIRQMFF